MTSAVEILLLGPLEARVDAEALRIGGQKQRAILAMLALDSERVVSAQRLIEGLWGQDAPDGASSTLQVHVSNLRKALPTGVVVTRPPGYCLTGVSVDSALVDQELREARSARSAGERTRAMELLERALDRWRGPSLDDLTYAPFALSAAQHLSEQRAHAIEDLAELRLEAGLHRQAIGDIEIGLRDYPHREGLWASLMLALYRSDRQADALAAFQRARTTLGEELGIDPSPALRSLENAILVQDSSLELSGAADADYDATYKAALQVDCRFEIDELSEYRLEGRTVIGRHADCDITLADPSISRRHAEVRPSLGGYLLIDLDSTNGTTVNDEPVASHVLRDKDLVRIGAHLLRFRSERGPALAD